VDAIGDKLGANSRVSQHSADDAGVTMTERSHGIKHMRGLTGPEVDCGRGLAGVGIGMPDRGFDVGTEHLANQFRRG